MRSRAARNLCSPRQRPPPADSPLVYSTYRDDRTLSELDIAECLATEHIAQSAPDAQVPAQEETACLQGSAQSADQHICNTRLSRQPCLNAEVPSSSAQGMAWRRRLRQCHANTQHASSCSIPNTPVSFTRRGSSVLERRPKVQLAYQLQGCVTEAASPALQSESFAEDVIEGDEQLRLWYMYSEGRQAEQAIVSLHSQLQQVPEGKEAAAALGFTSTAQLAQCLKDGQVARSKLLAAHMGLVRQLARQYSKEVSVQDLIQEGIFGLERGLQEFDPSRGAKVSTGVYWYIRDAVFKAKRLQSNAIHVPLTTQEQAEKLRKATLSWHAQHPNQPPSPAQLGLLTNMKERTLRRVMQASAQRELSLDLPITDSSPDFAQGKLDNWVDRLVAQEDDGGDMVHLDLQTSLAMLPDPLGVIVQEKYGLIDGQVKTYKEVADLLDIQKWKVQDYCRKAMATLRSQQHVVNLVHAL